MHQDTQKNSAVLLISCPDQRGLVFAITRFIHAHAGNIIDLEQHVDRSEEMFFMRIEWDLDAFDISSDAIGEQFQQQVAGRFNMQWSLHFSHQRPRVAIFVSKYAHCLYEILSRYQAGEWQIDIPLVISNHQDFADAAANAGIAFQYYPVTRDNKSTLEAQQVALLHEHNIDLIILARYMQILSPQFIRQFQHKIINIHHSFLPAFPGARPYHSAYERGVKIIGATSHYVTDELDAGPIIAQDVEPVRHTDSVEDLIRIGQDIEKIVLSRAIWAHVQHKTLVYKNRTIIFE